MPDSHHSNGQRCQRTIKLSTQIKSSGLNKSAAELKTIITTKVTVVRNSQRRLKVGETLGRTTKQIGIKKLEG